MRSLTSLVVMTLIGAAASIAFAHEPRVIEPSSGAHAPLAGQVELSQVTCDQLHDLLNRSHYLGALQGGYFYDTLVYNASMCSGDERMQTRVVSVQGGQCSVNVCFQLPSNN